VPLILSVLLALLVVSPAAAADPDVTTGVRQVTEGDFEAAIPTLQSAALRLAADRAHDAERARALFYLGVAQVGVDRMDAAKASFKDALAADPKLAPTTAEFSPKVVQTFEAARAERRAEATAAAPGHGRSKTPWILGGVAVAAAIAAVPVAGGNGEAEVTFSNARFGTPVIVCPNGSHDLPLPFTILVDAESSGTAQIGSPTSTLIIVDSAFPSEIGFASSFETTASPGSVPSGRTTVTLQSTLLCGNGPGDAPRFNEWQGRVTLTTSSGTATLTTVDRMRVNLP
jgi:hypothetical protein